MWRVHLQPRTILLRARQTSCAINTSTAFQSISRVTPTSSVPCIHPSSFFPLCSSAASISSRAFRTSSSPLHSNSHSHRSFEPIANDNAATLKRSKKRKPKKTYESETNFFRLPEPDAALSPRVAENPPPSAPEPSEQSEIKEIPFPYPSYAHLAHERSKQALWLASQLRQLRDVTFRLKQRHSSRHFDEYRNLEHDAHRSMSAILNQLTATPSLPEHQLTIEDYSSLFFRASEKGIEEFAKPFFDLLIAQQTEADKQWRTTRSATAPASSSPASASSNPATSSSTLYKPSILHVPFGVSSLALQAIAHLTPDGPAMALQVLRNQIEPCTVTKPGNNAEAPRFQLHASLYTPILRELARNAKIYSMETLLDYFENIPPKYRNHVAFSSLIGGCLDRKLGSTAAQIFEVMRQTPHAMAEFDENAMFIFFRRVEAILYRGVEQLNHMRLLVDGAEKAAAAQKRPLSAKAKAKLTPSPAEGKLTSATPSQLETQARIFVEECQGYVESIEGYWRACMELGYLNSNITNQMLLCLSHADAPVERMLAIMHEMLELERVANEKNHANIESLKELPKLYLDGASFRLVLSRIQKVDPISFAEVSETLLGQSWRKRLDLARKLIDSFASTTASKSTNARRIAILDLDQQERALRITKEDQLLMQNIRDIKEGKVPPPEKHNQRARVKPTAASILPKEVPSYVPQSTPVSAGSLAESSTVSSPTTSGPAATGPATSVSYPPSKGGLHPSSRIFLQRLRELSHAGDWQTAQALAAQYMQTAATIPWNPVLFSMYLSCFVKGGRWVEAEETWKKMKEYRMIPIDVASYRNMILVYYHTRDQIHIDKTEAILHEMSLKRSRRGNPAPAKFNGEDYTSLIRAAMKLNLSLEVQRWVRMSKQQGCYQQIAQTCRQEIEYSQEKFQHLQEVWENKPDDAAQTPAVVAPTPN